MNNNYEDKYWADKIHTAIRLFTLFVGAISWASILVYIIKIPICFNSDILTLFIILFLVSFSIVHIAIEVAAFVEVFTEEI